MINYYKVKIKVLFANVDDYFTQMKQIINYTVCLRQ
jgi:hypothetical protein